MTERVRRLRRGEVTPRQLGEVLDEIGVAVGDSFDVAAVQESLPRARSSDPSTSQRGAVDALPRAGTHKAEVLKALALVYPRGLTAHEVGEATGIDGIWKRCSELHQDGLLCTDGERLVEKTGSMAEVYKLTPRALTELPREVLVPQPSEQQALLDIPSAQRARSPLDPEDT